jgi:hypothetical protein
MGTFIAGLVLALLIGYALRALYEYAHSRPDEE